MLNIHFAAPLPSTSQHDLELWRDKLARDTQAYLAAGGKVTELGWDGKPKDDSTATKLAAMPWVNHEN